MAAPGTLYQSGDHASRPASGAGCVLYSCTDHDLVYRDDGSSWATFMTLATGGEDAGAELDYVAITSPVTVSATAEASATTLITGSSVAYDGSTAVIIEAWFPYIAAPAVAGGLVALVLYDGASSIGQFGMLLNPAGAALRAPFSAKRRLTPSAASHTYSIRAFRDASGTGTATAHAAAGGSTVHMPAFMRITRA